MSAIDVYLERNAGYEADFSKGDLPKPPSGLVAIVTCMDSRMMMGAMLGLEEGEAHVIRNAGGVVTEDVIRSLAISQCLMGTREIMFIHHTDCGLSAFTEAELSDAIEEKTGVRPPFAMQAFTDLEGDVRTSIELLRESPFVPHMDAIRGFVYEVETGRLREVK